MLTESQLVAYQHSQGWVLHAQALERLLLVRGPKMHKDTLAKSLFRAQRAILVRNPAKAYLYVAKEVMIGV
jgi:hypothetical protein